MINGMPKQKRFLQNNLFLFVRIKALTMARVRNEPRSKGPFTITKVLDKDRHVVIELKGSKRSRTAYVGTCLSDRLQLYNTALSSSSDDTSSDDHQPLISVQSSSSTFCFRYEVSSCILGMRFTGTSRTSGQQTIAYFSSAGTEVSLGKGDRHHYTTLLLYQYCGVLLWAGILCLTTKQYRRIKFNYIRCIKLIIVNKYFWHSTVCILCSPRIAVYKLLFLFYGIFAKKVTIQSPQQGTSQPTTTKD